MKSNISMWRQNNENIKPILEPKMKPSWMGSNIYQEPTMCQVLVLGGSYVSPHFSLIATCELGLLWSLTYSWGNWWREVTDCQGHTANKLQLWQWNRGICLLKMETIEPIIVLTEKSGNYRVWERGRLSELAWTGGSRWKDQLLFRFRF